MEYPYTENNLEHFRGAGCLLNFQGKRAAISFTGGKDSHLALQRALEAGLNVVCFVNYHPPSEKFQVHTGKAHRLEWQRIQAEAIGIPFVLCPLLELEKQSIKGLPLDYKAAYAAAIRIVQEEYGIDVILTGDVDYIGASTTNFKQQVCLEQDCNGVIVLLPLWKQSRKVLLQEMINQHGLDIRLSCVKSPHFDASWIGKQIDAEAIAIFEAKEGLDLNGENGEYHTMVVNGSMYKTPLQFHNVQAKELTKYQQEGASDQKAQQQQQQRVWILDDSTQLLPRHVVS